MTPRGSVVVRMDTVTEAYLAFGGIIVIDSNLSQSDVIAALVTMSVFVLLMSLGVWHVFRKRGRIYI